jgi:hypothetical protein
MQAQHTFKQINYSDNSISMSSSITAYTYIYVMTSRRRYSRRVVASLNFYARAALEEEEEEEEEREREREKRFNKRDI